MECVGLDAFNIKGIQKPSMLFGGGLTVDVDVSYYTVNLSLVPSSSTD